MNNNLTIVIPNRNRDLKTVKRSLDSLQAQLRESDLAVVVDYGSSIQYQEQLQTLINAYKNIKLIPCPTQGQLWNKSRCINIVLQQCETPFFMVCDMDMIWHPQFIEIESQQWRQDQSFYYSVGIMTQQESLQDKTYNDYQVKFHTDDEATGITVFPTAVLKSINGFDEFYHGWGAEDSDAHMRLRHAGHTVSFKNDECYFKHQWHPKTYRSLQSDYPFHSNLERINHYYFTLSQKRNKTTANRNHKWGQRCNDTDYQGLEQAQEAIKIHATQEETQSFLSFFNDYPSGQTLKLIITQHPDAATLKTFFKKIFKKKIPRFISLQQVNDTLLQNIINHYRNCPYRFNYDVDKETIEFTICKVDDV